LVFTLVLQWFTQEVTLKFLGFFPVSFHRDENPATYWGAMLFECVLVFFFVYCWF
jgi:hypothetical protein